MTVRREAPGTQADAGFRLEPPQIALPRGGGAIRGIGEKFSANAVTGTGSLSVPIGTSPSRAGFGPSLAVTYDSGAGNGPFGLGWRLSLPTITRKTDKGLPRYRDAAESDVFILAGAEDLVPVLDANGKLPEPDALTVHGKVYLVRAYRPRVEGAFSLIERWTEQRAASNVFWRTVSRANVTSWYGRSPDSRVRDPGSPEHIFEWHLTQQSDDRGNVMVLDYRREDAANVDLAALAETNRPDAQRTANVYPTCIRYGNVVPHLPTLATDGTQWPTPDDEPGQKWMFEVVFDYGDHPGDAPTTQPTAAWPVRHDPFSTHRAGFEVRTYRLCRRILMFHHFEAELGAADYLVRSTDFDYAEPNASDDPARPGYTVLASVTQRAYQKRAPDDGSYEARQWPPITFEYSTAEIDPVPRALDPAQLENLPVGIQGAGYRWLDLDGEGLPGVLTEQAGGWHYKPNLGGGHFGPTRTLGTRPALSALNAGNPHLVDVDGDGELELVDFAGPVAGFHERDPAGGWQRFVPFTARPNIDWAEPNLRFVDLTGNGLADVLITGDDVLSWYPGLGDEGFAAAEHVFNPGAEESAPRVVFADGTQTVFLADMTGDGLTDLVRIRNREVSFWPNLGYARFGRRVRLSNVPPFDTDELFDPLRIRLGDIDGSGPADIVYLGHDATRVYFNRGGNRLSDPLEVDLPVATQNLDAVQLADLMGNGTACLVWNSHLPASAGQPVWYIDLMGGRDEPAVHGKPHLLIGIENNLGVTTKIEYTPSTHFYVADRKLGRPWATRLPFPVHCVSRITVRDRWRGTQMSSSYSYHHGYFDGVEREFRGFGRIEQVDVEEFGSTTASSPYVTSDRRLHQPPVKTITWYHTGAALDSRRLLSQFEAEYFPARYAFSGAFREKQLTEVALPPGLTSDEWREAMRACKGKVLRQEVYELDLRDVTAATPRETAVRLFSAASHGCGVVVLQRRGANPHAVFQVLDTEAVTYQYDLELPAAGGTVDPDPRVSHTLSLRHDEQGNTVQSVMVSYARWGTGDYAALPRADVIASAQGETHLSYAERRFTKDVVVRAPASAGARSAIRHWRLRLPSEAITCELKGIVPASGRYFERADFLVLDLSDFYGHRAGDTTPPQPVERKRYHEFADGRRPQKRAVEHACTRYFDDASDTNPPATARPLGFHGPRGLTYETYKFALTNELLDAVFTERDIAGQVLDDKLAWIVKPAAAGAAAVTARDLLDRATTPGSPYLASGYIRGSGIDASLPDGYWMRSGTAGFAPDAHRRFFTPDRYADAFGNDTTLRMDARCLYFVSSTDARRNPETVEAFDYRVLAASRTRDANANINEVAFDVRGLPAAAAQRGKVANTTAAASESGDGLEGLSFDQLNPGVAAVATVFDTDFSARGVRRWLGKATTRFLYSFGETLDAQGRLVWLARPPAALGISREQHERDFSNVDSADETLLLPVQVNVEYSDGSGAVLVKKAQAEPDPADTRSPPPLRWIASGKTVLNNKGRPVKQFEPYFSATGHRFDPNEAAADVGVSVLLFHDAQDRLIRSEFPDGTFSRSAFSPWDATSYDANDTVLDSPWYAARGAPRTSDPEPTDPTQRAAWLSAQHANTPALQLFDSLGRNVMSVAHNRAPDANGAWRDSYYSTFTKLDAEGKPLWVRDARGNLVTQYITPIKPTQLANDTGGEAQPASSTPCYDIAGNLLYVHGLDSGDRWTLTDGAGRAMLSWDINKRTLDDGSTLVERRLYSTSYDELHRPVETGLSINSGTRQLIALDRYLDTADFIDAAGNVDAPGLAAAQADNRLMQPVARYDSSGLITVERVDFKGLTEHETRTLVSDATAAVIDWGVPDRTALLEGETFRRITEHDALGRVTRLFNWHRDTTAGTATPGASDRVAVHIPRYNARGLLDSERLHIRATKTTSNGRADFTPDVAVTRNVDAIRHVQWDVKGRRSLLALGNGTITRYTYDPVTFRLVQLYTGGGLQNLRYTYDAVGNLARIQDDAQDTVWFANTQVDASSDYTYDALYRLIRATGRENVAAQTPPAHPEGNWPTGVAPSVDAMRRYTESYDYDEVGNFRLMNHAASVQAGQPSGNWTRHYDTPADTNQTARTWYGSSTGNAITYRYDTHGSIGNLANTAPGLDIRWDHRDMIRALDLQGGGLAYYNYASDKARTRKQLVRNPNAANGGTLREDRIYLSGFEIYRRYTGDPADPVEEIESHHLSIGDQRVLLVDDVIRTRKPRPDGAIVRAQTLFRYQYCTHLGSTCAELDADAQLISYEEFHPFGGSAYRAMNSAIEAPPTRYRFAGLERDEESSLLYSIARYYTPTLGRWLSCDPGGFVDGFNLYAYARNSPVVHADVNGREVVVATGTAIAVAAETGGLPATATIGTGTWSATIANFSGTSTATLTSTSTVTTSTATLTSTATVTTSTATVTAPAAAASTSAGASASAGVGVGVGTAAAGAALILFAVLAVPAMIALGFSDAESRQQRYEAEAAAGHQKYLESLKQEPYVATEAQRVASQGLADQLLGRTPGKGPVKLPGADNKKGPAIAPPAPAAGPKIAPGAGGKGPARLPSADEGKGAVKVPGPENAPKSVELAKTTPVRAPSGEGYWTDQEHQSARLISNLRGSLVHEQIELYIEKPDGTFKRVPGVRFDAIEIMQDGTVVLHEWTTAKQLGQGKRKQAQIKRMRDALIDANQNGDVLVARPQGSFMVYDVNTATCYIGTYPHWRQNQQQSRYGPGY